MTNESSVVDCFGGFIFRRQKNEKEDKKVYKN